MTNVVSKSAYIYSQQYFAAPSSYLHLPLPWGSYFYIQINIFHNILFERSMYCCSDLSYLLPVIGQLELMSSANHRQQTALVAATVHIMSLKQQMLCFCFTKCYMLNVFVRSVLCKSLSLSPPTRVLGLTFK